MRSYEALEEAIGRRTREFAKRLGLSMSLLNKWQEPTADWSDSGAYNPLDRVEGIVQTALDLGAEEEKALAPIYWLADRFGLTISEQVECTDADDASLELVDALREMGHFTTAASDALASGEITKVHVDKIEREGRHLIQRVLSFAKKTREMTRKKLHLFRRKTQPGEDQRRDNG